jgi:hypothetical protein
MHHLLIWAGSAQPTVSMYHANKASVEYPQRKEKHLLIHLSWNQYTENTNPSDVSNLLYQFQKMSLKKTFLLYFYHAFVPLT